MELEINMMNFRRTKGCFDKALSGIENCKKVNQKVGVRFTINSHNYRSNRGYISFN